MYIIHRRKFDEDQLTLGSNANILVQIKLKKLFLQQLLEKT